MIIFPLCGVSLIVLGVTGLDEWECVSNHKPYHYHYLTNNNNTNYQKI
jgi:hypothetical protein